MVSVSSNESKHGVKSAKRKSQIDKGTVVWSVSFKNYVELELLWEEGLISIGKACQELDCRSVTSFTVYMHD